MGSTLLVSFEHDIRRPRAFRPTWRLTVCTCNDSVSDPSRSRLRLCDGVNFSVKYVRRALLVWVPRRSITCKRQAGFCCVRGKSVPFAEWHVIFRRAGTDTPKISIHSPVHHQTVIIKNSLSVLQK